MKATNRCKKFKFWNFQECPLNKIWSLSLNKLFQQSREGLQSILNFLISCFICLTVKVEIFARWYFLATLHIEELNSLLLQKMYWSIAPHGAPQRKKSGLSHNSQCFYAVLDQLPTMHNTLKMFRINCFNLLHTAQYMFTQALSVKEHKTAKFSWFPSPLVTSIVSEKRNLVKRSARTYSDLSKDVSFH